MLRRAPGVDPQRFVRAVGDVVWTEARILKTTDESSVLRATLAGVDLVAKTQLIAGPRRWIQSGCCLDTGATVRTESAPLSTRCLTARSITPAARTGMLP